MLKTNKNRDHLWEMLGNTPVNNDGELEEVYLDFPIGTQCEEIWSWFEETFDVSVYRLMYPNTNNKQTNGDVNG